MKTIQGETWDMISYRAYGTEMRTDDLIAANFENRDTSVFPAGVDLVIPEAESDNINQNTLPPWRRA